MKAAALAFATVLLREYESWACEIVKRETVNVHDWIKEHRPNWLVGS